MARREIHTTRPESLEDQVGDLPRLQRLPCVPGPLELIQEDRFAFLLLERNAGFGFHSIFEDF